MIIIYLYKCIAVMGGGWSKQPKYWTVNMGVGSSSGQDGVLYKLKRLIFDN